MSSADWLTEADPPGAYTRSPLDVTAADRQPWRAFGSRSIHCSEGREAMLRMYSAMAITLFLKGKAACKEGTCCNLGEA